MITTDAHPSPVAAIDVRELVHMRPDDAAVLVIDVRTPGEFHSGHIDGSYNVPLDSIDDHIAELAAVDRDVVLVCRSGARATKALARLEAAGKSNLSVLDGGITAWSASGGDVERINGSRWAMERQVRLVAGGAVVASLAGSLWFSPARLVSGLIGAGLVFSAVTNTCGMASVLAKLPYNRAASCDVHAVVERLTTAETTTRAEL